MNEKDTACSSGENPSTESRRFDFDHALDESGLPTDATECVRRVMSKLRLWPGERADVASELIAHFIDGIDAGRSIEELVANFGDPSRTAALITRAKKRQRGCGWRSLQLLAGTAIALIVSYSVLTCWFYSSRSQPNVDYVAILRSKMKSVPESERAYPLYAEASDALKPLKAATERLRTDLRQVTPQDPKWSDVVAILNQCAPSIEKTREAAGKPGMGYWLPDVASNDAPPLVLNAALRMHDDFIILERLLYFDAIAAAHAGNASLAAADIEAQLRMADHVGEIPLLLYGMLGVVSDSIAFITADTILVRYPALFDHEQLRRLADRIATGSITLAPYWEGEYLAFADVIQRIYTDDGHGNGHLAGDYASVIRELAVVDQSHQWWQTAGTAAIMPIRGFSAPARRDTLRLYRDFIDLTIADSVSHSNDADARIKALSKQFPSFIFGPAILSIRSNNDIAAARENERQALLVAISLELYQLEEGAWPSTMDALVPRFLPSVAADRLTGQALAFRIEHDRPIVFSAGRPSRRAENILWPEDKSLRDLWVSRSVKSVASHPKKIEE